MDDVRGPQINKVYRLTSLRDDPNSKEGMLKKNLTLKNNFKLVWNEKKGIVYDKTNETQTLFSSPSEAISLLLRNGYDLHQDVYDALGIDNDFNMASILGILRFYSQDIHLVMDKWVSSKQELAYPLKFKLYYCKNDKRLVLNIHDVKEDVIIACRKLKNIVAVLIDLGLMDINRLDLFVRTHRQNRAI